MDSDLEDARLDALAILAAYLGEDFEGIAAVMAHCDITRVAQALAGMLVAVLRDHDADPAEWVAERQARHRPNGTA